MPAARAAGTVAALGPSTVRSPPQSWTARRGIRCGRAVCPRSGGANWGCARLYASVNLAAVAEGNLEQAARQAPPGILPRAASPPDSHVSLPATRRAIRRRRCSFVSCADRAAQGWPPSGRLPREGLVRPLLQVERAEVEQFLRERGIAWREDSSNASLRFARNRIRHSLLPQLASEWNPAIGDALRRTADWALAEEAYWDGEIGRLANQFRLRREGSVFLRVEILRELPLAVGRRLVRRALESAKGDLRGCRVLPHRRGSPVGSVGAWPWAGAGAGVEVERSLDWLRFVHSDGTRSSYRGVSAGRPCAGGGGGAWYRNLDLLGTD